MAAFPLYVKLGWRETGEVPAPVVARSEMDRGVAKQRRIAADTVVQMPVTAYFDTKADATSFKAWVYSTINGGADWFDLTHPRVGGTVQARIVGGDIGTLKPSTKTWAYSERSFKLEYVESAL